MEVEAQEVPKEEQAEAKATGPQPIGLLRGDLAPSNSAELGAMIKKVGEGGGFPVRFDTPQKRLAAYTMAHALRGKRWQLCLPNLAFIKNQLVMFGELPGSLAEETGEMQEKEVFLINEKYERICTENKNLNDFPFAAVCHIQRTGRVKKEFTYNMEQARKAGQYPAMKNVYEGGKKVGEVESEDSPWNKFTNVMLLRKAMGLAIKFEFPDAIIGAPIAELDYDQAPDLVEERDVSEGNKANDLNKMF